MPRAIILTLVIATLFYLMVVSVVVLTVPLDQLSDSASPLNLVFSNASPSMRGSFNLIASVATLNGVLIQMIMASRVIYGLSQQGQLPRWLGTVHPKTRTPVAATVLVASCIVILSLLVPIEQLAEATSQFALAVFALVNVSLIRLKMREKVATGQGFRVPVVVPILGFCTCTALLAFALI